MAEHTQAEEHALNTIRRAGLRLTRPRRQIIAAMLENGEPLTSREVYDALGANACDPVTVYRCLTEFERLGLVHRHEFGDGSTRYQLVGADGGHYHYIVCRRCQRVERIRACPPPEFEEAVARRGYTNISHTLEFFAVCPECQEERSAAAPAVGSSEHGE